MKPASLPLTTNPVFEEIRQHFGFVPAYFRVAEGSPEILESLWIQMRTVRRDTRVPLLVKEKLAAYLATAVSLPYCMISHICELSKLGMSGPQIVAWLTQPKLECEQAESLLRKLAQLPEKISRWEDLGSAAEKIVLDSFLCMYQEPEVEQAFGRAFRRLFSRELFVSISFFAAYLRSAQSWMEDHPELDPAQDEPIWRGFSRVVAQCPEIGALVEKERREKWTFGFENQRLKQEVATARKMLEAREEFFSIASHELKTPLTSLKLQFELMQKSIRMHPTSKENDYLTRSLDLAQVQIHTLTRLINLLLDLARIRSGRFQLQTEELKFNEIIASVLERFQEEARLAGCELGIELDSEIEGCWDRVRVEQIVTNLVSNAVKYGRGKPVLVRAGRNPDGKSCFLEIRDQGIGISPEDQERIFDRFERAASEKRFSGLGLGLYITRQLVQAHSGEIRVDSRRGQGASFRVEMPLRATQKVFSIMSGT